MSFVEYIGPFGVASGALIPDVMHDILEGALPLEIKLMLKVSESMIVPPSESKFSTVVLLLLTCLLYMVLHQQVFIDKSLLPLILLMMVSRS